MDLVDSDTNGNQGTGRALGERERGSNVCAREREMEGEGEREGSARHKYIYALKFIQNTSVQYMKHECALIGVIPNAHPPISDGTFQPWMTKWAGKNGAEGNWINNFRIPFYKNVRVTAQIDPSRPTEIFPNASSGLFAIFRGVEGDENTLAGTVQLGGKKNTTPSTFY